MNRQRIALLYDRYNDWQIRRLQRKIVRWCDREVEWLRRFEQRVFGKPSR